MRTCNKCKIEKPFTEFSKDKTKTGGHMYTCKSCTYVYNKKYYPDYYTEKFNEYYIRAGKQREQNKLPYFIVYLLPNHNYVGVTNNPTLRMSVHRSYNKRNTDNWIELARYENRKDALKHEAELHSQGYEGAHRMNKHLKNINENNSNLSRKLEQNKV